MKHLLAGYKCFPFSISDPPQGYGLVVVRWCASGQVQLLCFCSGCLAQFAELGPTLGCTFSATCFFGSGCTVPISKAGGYIYVAAPQAGATALCCEVCLMQKVMPQPPLGNFYLKEYLQDFEDIQSFEKQIPGSDYNAKTMGNVVLRRIFANASLQSHWYHYKKSPVN